MFQLFSHLSHHCSLKHSFSHHCHLITDTTCHTAKNSNLFFSDSHLLCLAKLLLIYSLKCYLYRLVYQTYSLVSTSLLNCTFNFSDFKMDFTLACQTQHGQKQIYHAPTAKLPLFLLCSLYH